MGNNFGKYVLSYWRKKTSLESLVANPILRRPDFNKIFEISAPTLWNELPRTIREIETLSEFKSKLKDFYLINSKIFSVSAIIITQVHCSHSACFLFILIYFLLYCKFNLNYIGWKFNDFYLCNFFLVPEENQ